MFREDPRLDAARAFHARLMFAASGSQDPRLERAFEAVPREAFMGPGPWDVWVGRRYVRTPSDDPIVLYQNLLVGLDTAKGINNGEPFLHAAWLGAVEPGRGETVSHIGAGTGYYTALLSMLTLPDGRVHAFEIDAALAGRAAVNLRAFENVDLRAGDATVLPLPPSDVIYVNAGVVSPPPSWLDALGKEGRMILPWQASGKVGIALLIRRAMRGFHVRPLMPSFFIPCIGASDEATRRRVPSSEEAWNVRSLHLTRDRAPDASAVAVTPDVWFSTDPV